MGEYASVESFEALSRLRTALCCFADSVSAMMYQADAELQRTKGWVKTDQSRYWKKEGQKRAELLIRAKLALKFKKLQPNALGGRRSCVEEEEAVALATRRVEEAEQKAANVRHWSHRLDDEAITYQAMAAGMRQACSTDVPNAIARLDHMLAALEAYATSAPQMQQSVAGVSRESETEGVAEPGSMARAVAQVAHDSDDYRPLRRLTPAPSLRENAPMAALSECPSIADAPTPDWSADLARLNAPRAPVAAGDKIVLLHGVLQKHRIYLERLAGVCAGDSGWYVGDTDNATDATHDALSVADVLAARPEFAALLELPSGYLVVLNGSTLEAVIDAAGRVIGPSKETTEQQEDGRLRLPGECEPK